MNQKSLVPPVRYFTLFVLLLGRCSAISITGRLAAEELRQEELRSDTRRLRGGKLAGWLELASTLATDFDEWQTRSELLLIPSKKLAYCALPKVGSGLWKQLALRAEGDDRWSTIDTDALHDPVQSGLHLLGVQAGHSPSEESARNTSQFVEVFAGQQNWLKAVIVRDPVTRLLASYLDRCVEKGEACYKEVDTKEKGDADDENINPSTFAEVLDGLEAVVANGKRIDDVDFRPQVEMCGLRFTKYDIVGKYEKFDAASKNILKESQLWFAYGRRGWGRGGRFGKAAFRRQAADQEGNSYEFSQDGKELTTLEAVCHFYTPETLSRVASLYDADFKAFAYDTAAWKHKCRQAWKVESAEAAKGALALAEHGAKDPVTDFFSAIDGNGGKADGKGGKLRRKSKPKRPWGKAQCAGSLLVTASGSSRGSTFRGPEGVEREPNLTESGNSTVDLSPYCRPSLNDIGSLMPKPVQLRRAQLPNFFLHEEPSLGFQEVTRCFLNVTGVGSLSNDVFDNVVKPNVAEHLGELWLLKRLRRHPKRVYDPSKAQLHVLGTALYISRRASQMGGCGSEDAHVQRMTKLKKYVLGLKSFKKSQGKDFMIAMTHWDLRGVFTPDFMDLLNKGNIVVGTADAFYRQWQVWPNVRKIILPYKAHYYTEAQAWKGWEEQDRSMNFLFHGSMRETWDPRMGLGAVAAAVEQSEVRYLNFQEMDMNQFKWHALQTAQRFQRSRFCLVPSGDTPTTRRLFDALAAGCVPVILADFKRLTKSLPFPNTVDWTKIAVFGGRIECAWANMDGTLEWLRGLLNNSYDESCSRQRGREQFLKSLSYTYGRGLVDALLKEMAIGYLPKTASV